MLFHLGKAARYVAEISITLVDALEVVERFAVIVEVIEHVAKLIVELRRFSRRG